MSEPLSEEIALERGRRMALVWRKDVLQPSELAAMRGRLLRARQRHAVASRRLLALAIAAIALLAWGAWAAQSTLRARAPVHPAIVPPAASRLHSMLRPAHTPEPSEPVVALDVYALPLINEPARPTASAHAQSSAEQPEPRRRAAWTRAAEALNRGDTEAADKALEELTAEGSEESRDAAWLARAQTWVASGQPERARPVLIKLAASGATPLIRKRAAQTLSRMK